MAEAPTYTSLATEANKTIRISNIPISISRTVLQKCLQDQLDKRYGTIAKDNAGNLYISLAPDASAEDCQRFQVATVTFSGLVAVPSSVNLGPPGGTFEGTVDTHFRGLTQLNNPEDPEIDIIAVTGLAGHAFGSWRSRERPGMWLRDLLPKDMEDNGYMARVLTYGYDTTLNGSHSYAGVNDHSKQFLEAVKGARTMDPTRPLILIGHSLGGLIIKEAIVMSFEEGQGSTLRSCCGMLLFAVPHKGLAEAGLIGMVRGQSNEKLVQSLCGEGPYLSDLDQSFVRQITSTGIGPNIISFYETKDTRTVKISSSGKWERSGSYVRMVTKESVKHAAENSQLFSTDADHSSIVKFRNRSDQDYQFVRRKLLEIAGTIPTAPTEGEGAICRFLDANGVTAASKERIEICQWLYPGLFDERHVEISSKRQKSTGGWLLVDNKFVSWKDNSGSALLWGCGIPGAGKTFLSSLVIDVLDTQSKRRTSTTGLAYIYFNYKEPSQQVPITVLRSLIRQLITRSRALRLPLPVQVQSLHKKNCAAGSTPNLKDLQDALTASFRLFTRTFLIFDALDECQEDRRRELLALINWMACSGARVFVTSRPYPQDIADSLTNPNSHVQRLDLAANDEDVTIYVEKTIQEHDIARDLITGQFRAKVVSRLVEACKGICAWDAILRSESELNRRGRFLHVHFYIEGLCKHSSTREIRLALDSISSELGTERALNGTYSRAMLSIRKQPKGAGLALKVLTWLLTAYRTLTVDELRIAVAMGDGTRQGDTETFDLEEMPHPSSLVNKCFGLVMIDESTNTIKLVHYSVHEYLENTCELGETAKHHLTLALGCLDYLWLSYIEPEPRRECLQSSDGLIDYVRRNLHTHIQACHPIAPPETLLKFLQNTDLVAYIGDQQARMELHNYGVSLYSGCGAYGPLHAATEWGSTILINRLLSDGGGISADPGTSTPLHVAAGENLVDLVRFWLEKGVAVETSGGGRGTPLSWAIRRGSIDAARVLLSSGADVIAALQAPGWGREESRDPNMLELLFEFGLSVEHQTDSETYLVHAIVDDNSAVVELLLRKGAKIHVRGWGGFTPLHKAVGWNRTDIARLLLQYGYEEHEEEEEEKEEEEEEKEEVANLNAEVDVGGENAEDEGENEDEDMDKDGDKDKDKDKVKDRCSHCGNCGHMTPAGRLLDARDCEGRTPLHEAAQGDRLDILRLLLSHGIDGSSSGRNVRAPRLHEHAAAINARDKYGFTALYYASRRPSDQRTAMVQALLDAGADLTVPPRNHSGSYTWLHAAAELGNVALFKSALDAGVDPHARGDNNESPLHSAAYSGSVDIVSLLVDRGLSVNLRDKQDQTPLHYAWGAATIALLLERGACTSSTDTSGNSPLHSQLHKDSDGWPGRITSEAVRLLIRAGVDVNARNRSGATPLHFAARMGYAVPVSLLLKSGADIAALDVNQASAMHYAAMSGNCQDAVSVLVEWGLSIDARDEDQKTPLHHAALNEQILAHRIVELLVEKGASVGLRDSDGFTPLRYLVDRCLEYTTPHKVRTLIQAGADVNTVDDGGVSLLHLATQQCDEEMLALLLDAGADIHARDSSQRTPLHYSTHEINYTCEEKLRLLVKRGAHINAKDINGSTPLQYLLDRHYFMSPPHHAIQTMISLGADINVVSHHLQRSPLHLAAEGGSVQLLALLLDAGVDINVRESSQKTPLHYAVLAFFVRHPKIIIYLAGKGANMNARDTNGNTPMHSLMGVSRFMRGLDIAAQTLIFLGADVNAYRDDRKGPLHLAAESNSKELVAVLLDARADIHACDSKQRTPLHHAVLAKNDLKVIRYLADRGANVNARDIDGNTPLRILLGYAQLSWQVTDVAKVLLSFGADVNTVNDSDQNSPLHLAAKHGSKKLLVLLLHAGADRHACNCDQKTPLDIAITHRRSADITEMLVDRSNEHCPGMRVETDDATCDNDAPGQYPEDEPTRKRRYSIGTSTASNSIMP